MSGSDFWTSVAGSMNTFQSFSNTGDWYETVECLSDTCAAAIRNVASHSEIICADVGSGFCQGLRGIIGFLNFKHRIQTKWYAYEPDHAIAGIVQDKIIGGLRLQFDTGLVSATPSIDKFHEQIRGHVALVSFMHSTYYIDRLCDYLDYCLDDILREQGSIVILQMANDSPFYVLDEFRPRNGCEDLLRRFPQAKITERRMRFSLPEFVMRDDRFLWSAYTFLSNGRPDHTRFQTFLRKFIDVFGGEQEVDLRDEVLVIQRR